MITGVLAARQDAAIRQAMVLRGTGDGLPVSGRGIGVAVVDTGLDATHPDLKPGQNVAQNGVMDLENVPRDMYGYIQLALDLRLLTLKLQNVGQDRLKVRFLPTKSVTRAEFARAAVLAADFYAPR